MSIRALRYFIALADCLNFTRAAERCSVTQSTLSIQLRKLEEYLGVVLFERDRSHVALTAEGQRVLRLARVTVRSSRSHRKGQPRRSCPDPHAGGSY